MSKQSSKKKTKKNKVRAYLGEREIGAAKFLQNFPDFKDKSISQILKYCLLIVAVDAKVRLEEAKNNEKVNGSDGADNVSDDQLSAGDSGGQDQQGDRENPEA